MSDRDLILGKLPDADGGPVDERSGVTVKTAPAGDLWACFAERLAALGGEVAALSELEDLLDENCIVDPAAREYPDGPREDAPVWDAEVGVSMADFAVSETGSVFVSASGGTRRMGSLAPTINVVLVREDSIVATLEDAMDRMSDSTSVIISGPSLTGDIEGVLVRGVHGPRRLIVVRV